MNRAYLLKLIRNYKYAAIALSWMGSKHPDDHDDIKEKYREAKRKLNAYIYKNTNPW